MTPQFKVYRNKEYIAACRYAEDAAALVSLAGGEIRWGHSAVVWREGSEAFSAGQSYDGAANIMHNRINDKNNKAFAKTYRLA